MHKYNQTRLYSKGFTIVELIIIIIIIAILSTITIVAYNGIVARARWVAKLELINTIDEQMRVDAAKTGKFSAINQSTGVSGINGFGTTYVYGKTVGQGSDTNDKYLPSNYCGTGNVKDKVCFIPPSDNVRGVYAFFAYNDMKKCWVGGGIIIDDFVHSADGIQDSSGQNLRAEYLKEMTESTRATQIAPGTARARMSDRKCTYGSKDFPYYFSSDPRNFGFFGGEDSDTVKTWLDPSMAFHYPDAEDSVKSGGLASPYPYEFNAFDEFDPLFDANK